MIPVTFSLNNKTYSGTLTKVSGAANDGMYFLTVNGYHQGQLWKTDQGWRFSNKKGDHPELAKQFGEAVEFASKGDKSKNSP